MTQRFLSKRLINHAEYISKEMQKLTNIKIARCIHKVRTNYSQKVLTREQRHQNIRGNFQVNLAMTKYIKDKCILLIDDVTTTGSTLIEASKVLKIAEARKVICYVLAKDLLHNTRQPNL